MSRPKFSIVREDESLEAALVQRLAAPRCVLVASGGCTALSLSARFPKLSIAAFDINPVQLQHVRNKAEAATRGQKDQLNIEIDDDEALNQNGYFEGLFRVLRGFLAEFVEPDLEALLTEGETRLERCKTAFTSPYWPAAFETTFNQPFLHAMFGPEATQHAEPNSYPSYFQKVFERGLLKPGAPHNPFLQHILLGLYRAEDAPLYTRQAPDLARVHLVQGGLTDVPNLEDAQLYSLSNVFDWASDELTRAWASALKTAKPGSAILIRQLNNRRNLRSFFEPDFRFDDGLSGLLHDQDRSLFYNRVEVAFRT